METAYQIAVFHKLDGYKEYPKEKFEANENELQDVAKIYPNLMQIGNNLFVGDGDMYKIVEITIGVNLVMVYVIDC